MHWAGLLDDMNEIICDTFAQAVTYRRLETGEIFEIMAVFDIAYSQSDAGGKAEASIPVKKLDIRLKDIGNLPPVQDDTVLIDRTLYRVKDVEPSTSGMTKAILREVG